MWAFFFSALWNTGGALREDNPQQLPHNIDIQCALYPRCRLSPVQTLPQTICAVKSVQRAPMNGLLECVTALNRAQ
jgi:hypothetical protein